MTQTLRAFQDAFVQALHSGAASDPTAAELLTQPGFSVYRNTVTKGCVDALVANYPAVARLVGNDWFRAAAAVFVRQSPPRCPMLVSYGDSLPDFLATFEPAAELPYLSDVALLDRFWTEAHVAVDRTPIAAADMMQYHPDALARTVLHPHPSARWKWFANQPIYSLWRCNREHPNTDALGALVWRGEGALLVRPYATVEAIELSAGGCAFLDACAAGESLSDAGVAALGAEHDIDLSALVAQLFHAGAFGEAHR